MPGVNTELVGSILVLTKHSNIISFFCNYSVVRQKYKDIRPNKLNKSEFLTIPRNHHELLHLHIMLKLEIFILMS